MDNKPCMFFETNDYTNNNYYRKAKSLKKGDIMNYSFCWRIKKGCIFKYWDYEKTDFVMLEVVASFTSMLKSSKNIIELKKLT